MRSRSKTLFYALTEPLAGVFCSLMLAGCSHAIVQTDVSCQGIDWWEAGRTDGLAGLPIERSLKASHEKCDHSNHPVDVEAFENGHEAGLVDFCTPAQGLALGRNGLPYEKACPPELEKPFLDQYQIGLRLHALEMERSQAHMEKLEPSDTTL